MIPPSSLKAESVTVTLLRIVLGAIFMVHGWDKLTDIGGTTLGFAKLGIPEPQIMVYVAIAGEFLGGLGLVLGLATRLAALGTLCTMLVAIITVHLGHGLLAANGGWEYPLVNALVSLFFVSYGAGPISIDARLSRSRPLHFREYRVPSHA